jgi:hypothetical protein
MYHYPPEENVDGYINNPQIWVHCGIGSLVLVIAFILTAGYAITCRNM